MINCINNYDSASEQNKTRNEEYQRKINFQLFAGAATCANCHKDIYDKHIHNAHYLTSQPAFEKYIKGSFDVPDNSFSFSPAVEIKMEKRKDGYYQVEYKQGIETKAKRFDIVVGSGTMGQSYLYWMQNLLFQLPITYFTAAHKWSNSPGFPDTVVYNRLITSRCMECHSTYLKTLTSAGKEPEQFDQNQILYGVQCEKCHGPAAMHVAYQTKHPGDKIAKYILNPVSFTRLQKLEMCALCHGGRLQKTKPSFEFIPGDTLSNFFVIDSTAPDHNQIDVHGNQYGLLRASTCFKMSATLTCNSCHNVHENERGMTAVFSQRCQSCHSNGHEKICKLTGSIGAAIHTNCIDCHMPVKKSKAIAVFLPGAPSARAALIRSHYISIYPEETKKVIEAMKSTQ
ncbi:MAG: cytochrome c3 family protein [Ginsengibacter sp.]